MSREVRRVPKDWKHPKRQNPYRPGEWDYVPLYEDYKGCLQQWTINKEHWEKGLQSDHNGGWEPIAKCWKKTDFREYWGLKPKKKDYMPEWKEEEKTHIQMYETCSEGTPISPVMKTPEELARWLADNGASAFGSMTATYDQWLATILREHSVGSMYCSPTTGLISGVALSEDLK